MEFKIYDKRNPNYHDHVQFVFRGQNYVIPGSTLVADCNQYKEDLKEALVNKDLIDYGPGKEDTYVPPITKVEKIGDNFSLMNLAKNPINLTENELITMYFAETGNEKVI